MAPPFSAFQQRADLRSTEAFLESFLGIVYTPALVALTPVLTPVDPCLTLVSTVKDLILLMALDLFLGKKGKCLQNLRFLGVFFLTHSHMYPWVFYIPGATKLCFLLGFYMLKDL